ncbi:phosphoribosylaminoimidazolesuccinocarboxamide synthase [Deinococcus misasensis]|uniref:phosphoribosylaminoimidazolesuccinocarboxamide synthase n=1 Tax=Deinococcus misasensis TaxID=392413 RepID=UPI000555121C|nr:phosphoribosylaminoimidazolesuccinocarboxamide synthase [Deinococcus misasensis]
MQKLDMRYEGKAKRVYATEDKDLFVVEYKDDATAFNAQKRGTIGQKGVVNNAITAILFPQIAAYGVPTHFVEKLSDREQLVKAVTIVPVEIVVRNVAAGSFSKRLGVDEGTPLSQPVVEYCYKSDALGDPLINTDTAVALGWASLDDLSTIKDYALKVNLFLKEFFLKRGIKLVDFKLEFGKLSSGEIVLADEISPDTCRFWDANTGEKLDKDRFRRDLGNVEEAYLEMLRRVEAQ